MRTVTRAVGSEVVLSVSERACLARASQLLLALRERLPEDSRSGELAASAGHGLTDLLDGRLLGA